MEIRELLSKPVWQMTGEEFILLNRHALQEREARAAQPIADTEKKYVYGIGGIARLFGCSMPTANRIKKSGKIDRAITQIGRKIIVDADMALELAGHKSGGRRYGGTDMEYRERKEVTPEAAVILWQASRLDLSEDYERAPEILKVHGSVIGTLGNFSASIGKAKSKKTFNVSAIVAAALKNGTVLSYTAELPENRRKILYVDTEQSSYHCAKVAKRILRMAGLPTGRNHKDLEFLVLRKYTPEERIAIVREAIYRTENVGLVVIDGIRDMVYDINSPSESTKVISLLMTWTGERHIHIHTILHQNKGDENARGHIGTELSNKAETVLQVEKDEKDPDISTVKAAHIRAMNFEPFAFRINGEALPELLDEYLFKHKDPGKGKREKFDPYKDITEKQHRIALEAAFTLKDEYGYKELAEELRETYASVGVMLGGNRLTDLITVLKNKRMIVQENGRKYTFKPDFHY